MFLASPAPPCLGMRPPGGAGGAFLEERGAACIHRKRRAALRLHLHPIGHRGVQRGRFPLNGPLVTFNKYSPCRARGLESALNRRSEMFTSGLKVWGHPDNSVFSMKTLTFICQINFKMNIKFSQDIEEVINNDFYCKY